MLDSYFWNDVKKILPATSLPIVEIDDELTCNCNKHNILQVGRSIKDSVYLANYVGGIACEVAGIVPTELNN